MDKITDVSGGKGGKAFLIQGEDKTALIDCGMAYCAAGLIGNIKRAIDGKKLDYIFITHSHYDHIGAIPYLRETWPAVKVLGAEYAKRVLGKSSALQTIRMLGEEAAQFYAAGKLPAYDDSLLRVDVVIGDGDMVDLGGVSVTVVETKGHTQCSLSFLVNDILFASESSGFMSESGEICPAYVASYVEAMRSIDRCRGLDYRYIISPHYGPVCAEDTPHYWQKCYLAAKETCDFILALARQGHDEKEILEKYEEKFRDEESRREQPASAFQTNIQSMIKTVLKERVLLESAPPQK